MKDMHKTHCTIKICPLTWMLNHNFLFRKKDRCKVLWSGNKFKHVDRKRCISMKYNVLNVDIEPAASLANKYLIITGTACRKLKTFVISLYDYQMALINH